MEYIENKPQKSKGAVIIKGTPNTVIEVGTKVASDTYIYVTTEEKIIGASGSVEVPIESENTGKIYNLPKNTNKQISYHNSEFKRS